MMMAKISHVFIPLNLAEKLSSLITKANIKVESYWANIFASAIKGADIPSFFNFAGGSSASSAPVSDAPVVK